MKRNQLKNLLLLTVGLTLLAFTGCQSSKNEAKTDPKAETTVEATETAEVADDEEAGIKDTDEDGADAPTPDDEYVEQTPLDEIEGEGSPDTTVPDIANMDVAEIGTPVVISDESGNAVCSVLVKSIKFTEDRNQDDAAKPSKAVIVDYTYENTASEESIMIDDMSFKLVCQDALCTPYYLNTLKAAEPAEKGKTIESQVSFAVPDDATDVTLVFDNTAFNTKAAFTAKLS